MKKQVFYLLCTLLMVITLTAKAQVKILPNGNVGIGTTTPDYKLTLTGANNVFGVDNTAIFLAKNTAGTYEGYFWPRWSDNKTYLNYGSGGFNIRNNTSTSTMYMTSTGNVGIGTASPGQKFVVYSTASLNSTIQSYSTSTHARNWVLNNYNGIGTGFALGVDGTGYGGLLTGTPTSAAYIMTFSNAGHFCMGNTPDNDYKLKISPVANKKGILSTTYHTGEWNYNIVANVNLVNTKAFAVTYNGADKIYMYGSGEAYAVSWYQTSDLSLKENIADIIDPLNKVIQLHGVTYRYKAETLNDPLDTITVIPNTPNPTVIGMIAQEVETIVPEVVKTNEKGIKGINYGGLIGLLVEAIKEQQKEINDLKVQFEECCKQNSVTPAGNE